MGQDSSNFHSFPCMPDPVWEKHRHGSYHKASKRIRQKVFRAGAMGRMTELLNILPFPLSPLFMAPGTCHTTMMNSGNYTGGKES